MSAPSAPRSPAKKSAAVKVPATKAPTVKAPASKAPVARESCPASGTPGAPLAPGRRRPLRQSLLIGLLCGALTFALGAWPAFDRPVLWSATASAVVLPDPPGDRAPDSGLYQTLGTGQLVRSLAAVGRLERIESAALAEAGAAVDEEEFDVIVQVLPDSWVVEAEVTAADRVLTELVADAVVEQATAELRRRAEPFSFEVLDTAAGSAVRTTGAVERLLALAAMSAVGVAVITQQLALHLVSRRPRQR